MLALTASSAAFLISVMHPDVLGTQEQEACPAQHRSQLVEKIQCVCVCVLLKAPPSFSVCLCVLTTCLAWLLLATSPRLSLLASTVNYYHCAQAVAALGNEARTAEK